MDPIALPEVTTESFSLISLFMQADLIVKAVMIILLVASVWSWAVAIDKWFSLMSANSKASRFENAFWSGQPLDEMSDRSSRNSGDAHGARLRSRRYRMARRPTRGGAYLI